MANNLVTNNAQLWDFVMVSYITVIMAALTLIISITAYWKSSKLADYLQQLTNKVASLKGLEKQTRLLETLHEERLLRLKMQQELLAISFQTSYVFRFAPESVKKQLEKHQNFFEQLEQLEQLSSECEVNSEKLYREAETWTEEIDPKVYEQLWSKASQLRNEAKNQLEIAKFVKSKLRLDKYS